MPAAAQVFEGRIWVAFQASFWSNPPNLAMTRSGELLLPFYRLEKTWDSARWPARYYLLVRRDKTHLGLKHTPLPCVWTGRKDSYNSTMWPTPKADLAALCGIRTRAEPSKALWVKLGWLASRLLSDRMAWRTAVGLAHARAALWALLEILDTFSFLIF